MNKLIIRNTLRFVVLFLVQVLILKRIVVWQNEWLSISLLLYPLAFMLLPLNWHSAIVICIGFVYGLLLDVFYDSPGVHAATLVFSAGVRPLLLSLLQPRNGYDINQSPTMHHFGANWFLSYAAIFLVLHIFWYFSVEAFSFYYFGKIFMSSVFSFFLSYLLVIAYMILFNPKQ